MRRIKLIALDMDGSALNPRKELSAAVKNAIEDAQKSGVHVCFCTGRSFAEVEEFLPILPKMQYLSIESGALLYDAFSKRPVHVECIAQDTVRMIYNLVRNTDIVPQIFSQGRNILARRLYENLSDYYMGVYQKLYEKVGTISEDPFELVLSENATVEKLNLYHLDPLQREHTRDVLLKNKADICMIYSEITSLECTLNGIDKGSGIDQLSKTLAIPKNEIAMVGDALNDIPAMQASGYSVAMGNALEEVKAVADYIAPGYDQDGCAQAIYHLLRL